MDEFELDLVLIQCGCFFEGYLDSAIRLNKSYKLRLFKKYDVRLGEYPSTGIPEISLEKWINKFNQDSYKYAFIGQIHEDNNFIRREVTISNVKEALDSLGGIFGKKVMFQIKTNDISKVNYDEISDEIRIFELLKEGINPINGEYFESNSPIFRTNVIHGLSYVLDKLKESYKLV